MKDLSELNINDFENNCKLLKSHVSQFLQKQITNLKLNKSKTFTL